MLSNIETQQQKIDRLTRERDELRERAERAELTIGVRDATIHMACARLEGLVEGQPPGPHNFLQRIDELVAMERRLAAAGAAPRGRPDLEELARAAYACVATANGWAEWEHVPPGRRQTWRLAADAILAALDGAAGEPAAPAAIVAPLWPLLSDATPEYKVDPLEVHVFEDWNEAVRFEKTQPRLMAVNVDWHYHPASGRAGGAEGEPAASVTMHGFPVVDLGNAPPPSDPVAMWCPHCREPIDIKATMSRESSGHGSFTEYMTCEKCDGQISRSAFAHIYLGLVELKRSVVDTESQSPERGTDEAQHPGETASPEAQG